MSTILFGSWESIARIACLTTLGYVSIIVLLRASGKRTLSKMNAFDFIVTVALGSCLATVSLSKTITLADGITAFAIFIFLQYLLTWLSVRSKKVKSLLASSPTLLFYEGEFLLHALKEQRITTEDILSACRQKGFSVLDNIALIVLEATGDIAIVENTTKGERSTLAAIDARK